MTHESQPLYFLCHARLIKYLNVSSICLVLSWFVLTHATRPGGTPTLVDLDLEWGWPMAIFTIVNKICPE